MVKWSTSRYAKQECAYIFSNGSVSLDQTIFRVVKKINKATIIIIFFNLHIYLSIDLIYIYDFVVF